MQLRFDGETYEPELDQQRLTGQYLRVFSLMSDGDWHSLPGMSSATGDPEASISARLRDFRKQRFGGFEVKRERRAGNLWWYKLIKE